MSATELIYSKSALWVQDNVRVAGIKSVTPPALTAQIGNYQPAWMDMPIPVDTGMSAMQLEYKAACDIDVLSLFGIVAGGNSRAIIKRTFKDTANSFHTWTEEFEGIVGTITSDETTVSGQEGVGMSVTMNLSYYKLTIDGTVTVEIDPAHMIRSINGVNQLQAEKDAFNM